MWIGANESVPHGSVLSPVPLPNPRQVLIPPVGDVLPRGETEESMSRKRMLEDIVSSQLGKRCKVE